MSGFVPHTGLIPRYCIRAVIRAGPVQIQTDYRYRLQIQITDCRLQIRDHGWAHGCSSHEP